MFFVIIFIFGSCIGSFLNVVIYRLPIIIKNNEYNDALDFLEDQAPKTIKKFNLSYPSSHCPQCKSQIPFWANIPIIGYFITKMRCHHCHLHIPFRYPLVEATTAAMFWGISYLQPNLFILSCCLILISIITCCILISYDGNHLPSSLTLPLLWIGILINTKFNFAPTLTTSVIGAISGYFLIQVFLLILALADVMSFRQSLKSMRLHIQKIWITGFKTKNINDTAILTAAIGGCFGYIAILQIIVPATIIFLLYNLISPKLKTLNLTILIGIFGSIYLFYLNYQNFIYIK